MKILQDKGLYQDTEQGNADMKGKGVNTLMKNIRKTYK